MAPPIKSNEYFPRNLIKVKQSGLFVFPNGDNGFRIPSMKKIIFIGLLILPFLSFGNIEKVNPPTPNEKLVYYHIHQASKWAELYYTNKTVHAPLEMGIHLGKVKFSEENLVYSHFYQEFILLYSLIHDFSKSSLGQIKELGFISTILWQKAKFHTKIYFSLLV